MFDRNTYVLLLLLLRHLTLLAAYCMCWCYSCTSCSFQAHKCKGMQADSSPSLTWVFCCVLQQHGYILTGHAFKVVTHVRRASAATATAAVSAAAACALAATVMLLQIPVLLRLPLLLVVLLLFSSLQSVLAICLCDAKVCIKVCEPAVGILHWFPAARLCSSCRHVKYRSAKGWGGVAYLT